MRGWLARLIHARGVFALPLAVTLAGCDQQAAFDRLVPHEEAGFAERYLERLAARDFEAVEAGLNPTLRSGAIRDEIHALAGRFPSANPLSVNLVGSNTSITPKRWRAQFTFEYEYPGQWLLAGVAMARVNDKLVVEGINVERTQDSVKNMNRFSLADRSARHYVFLAAAFAIVAFVIYSLACCMRAPIRRMKWLWMVFILLGIGTFRLNWTSGDIDFVPFQVLLFSVGFQKLLYSPLVLSIAMPLGAVVFHAWQRAGGAAAKSG